MSYTNQFLRRARAIPHDEFYTRYEDIEQELTHYTSHFTGKTVYCNCDDPYQSQFFAYFVNNFHKLGLKKLISTCWNGIPTCYQPTLFDDSDPVPLRTAYKAIVTRVNNGMEDVFDIDGNTIEQLSGNGDFRSPECRVLLDEADIVVTNPPFSLFRELVELLVEAGTDFILLGNVNAVTYRDFWKLYINNVVSLGVTKRGGGTIFHVPDDYPLTARDCGIDDNGAKFINVEPIRWWTTLNHGYVPPLLEVEKTYAPELYPKYDNCDAIDVDRVGDIPRDYSGVMGVPITFVNKWNRAQFEIVGWRKGDDGRDLRVNGKEVYCRILIRKNP